MAEAAGALETWAAFDLMVDDIRAWAERPGARRVGRAEDADRRNTERRRQMHRARIVAGKAVA